MNLTPSCSCVLLALTLALLPIGRAEDSIPEPDRVPQANAESSGPYQPRAIVPGGIVLPLYAADSPLLNQDRVHEAEQYRMTEGTPGRIQSIINIHNPSVEVHTVPNSINTGTTVILAAGGGHRTLNVGTEAADFVPFFYNFGVNTVILRNRLRSDGYSPQEDAVHDALQAIRLVRHNASEWNLDPHRIGIIGFSAGAELAAPAAIHFAKFDREKAGDELSSSSSRPDFVGLLYPGPTPFARGAEPPVPRNAPPSFIASAGSGDRVHAIWADEYFSAMLRAGIPNLEMHIYGNGVHAGGLRDRGGIPFGTWQHRYIDWFRDLGFLDTSGSKTKAAEDSEAFVQQPPRRRRAGARGTGPRGGRAGRRVGPFVRIEPPARDSQRDDYVSDASYIIGSYVPRPTNHSPQAAAMAARRFLSSLRQDYRSRVLHPLDSPERREWTNVPPRPDAGGLRLGDCSEAQVRAFCDLLASVFSQQGYAKICHIMLADDQLLQGGRARPGFGTENFSVVIFGEPSPSEPWALQIDGHHVAVNLAIHGDEMTMSPSFIGTQPEAFKLAMREFRPLSGEIDNAFALVKSLTKEQAADAIVGKQRGDIRTGPGHDFEVPEAEGIRCDRLDQAQQQRLLALIGEWVRDLPPAHAERRMTELAAEMESLRFAWRGPTESVSDVSYAIQGPTLIIEYACQDLGGNPLDHLHTMYRDPTNEYGKQLQAP